VTALYGEICRSHAAIADFRAKLLALLPIASGAGIFLLLKKDTVTGSALTAAGIFGFVVTLGLFFYELRGIEDCVMLRRRADNIERHWQVPERAGHFIDRDPGRLGGLISEIGAGWVIYVAVMAGWLYVAGFGWDATHRPKDHAALLGHPWEWLLVASALAAIVLGLVFWRAEREPPPSPLPPPHNQLATHE
jgi:hypothetical protein